jgi:putative hydrolase of the HAD superfamily
LFDFFGTLVDYSESRTEQGYAQSYDLLVTSGSSLEYEQFLLTWDHVFREFERASDLNLDEFSMEDVCEEFLRWALPAAPNEAVIGHFRDVYLAEWNKGVEYLPGVPALLADLFERYNLVLVTNTHHAKLVSFHLFQMEVSQYFSAVVTSIQHGKKKPSPEIFAHALNISGGSRASSVYVGDSFEADYYGATNAGIDCLLIDPLQRYDVPQSSRINSILDIRNFLLAL